MQLEAFKPLLEKYKDFETNPGAEPLERTVEKMEQSQTEYYLIKIADIKIGAIRIKKIQNGGLRIAPMFILPEYQGKGYAQEAIKQVEILYPDAKSLHLGTIKEEKKLCHLYEKMGFKTTGAERIIKEGMTVVSYEKIIGA